MKVFISWSGERSRVVAAAFNHWLPRVIQAVETFFSPEIEKGARWSSELDAALEGTQFGIVCLTSDNLDSPWLHYETGALAKATNASVWTFLLDVTPGDVAHPLARFQHTLAEKQDILNLVRTINRRREEAGGKKLGEQLLTDIFEDAWPRLEQRLHEAAAATASDWEPEPANPEGRQDRELLEEILETLRAQSRPMSVRDAREDLRLVHLLMETRDIQRDLQMEIREVHSALFRLRSELEDLTRPPVAIRGEPAPLPEPEPESRTIGVSNAAGSVEDSL